ncbi:MAG: DegT/DnrJ/EryC1/StrS family aminotransferase [Vulcanimicrobiota bacterium]
MHSRPGILGGNPIFEKPLPFASPTVPDFKEVEKGFESILESGMLTKGKYLDQFEETAREVLEVPHALGVSNCTMGLFMLAKALGLTGEVIVPSFSFMATFHIIELAGLTPVFVDCERDTFTLDLNQAESAITEKTSGILGVCIFGNPPNMKGLKKLARDNNLKLMMDSAHSFGSLFYGQPMGSFGDGEAFSASPTKLLAVGEGGLVTTRHENVYEYIKMFREYGNNGSYDCEIAGINGRMSEFHALLGLTQLPKIQDLAERRNKIARFYIESLQNIPGIDFQKTRDGCRSSYKDFAIVVDEVLFGMDRDQLARCLEAENISTKKYFYPPGHKMTVYQKYASRYNRESFNNTDYISERILILPIYSHMNTEQATRVVEAVSRIYKYKDEITNKLQ